MSLLLVGLGVWMPSNASDQELKASEESFGWEFFSSEVSTAGTKIIDRGDENVLNAWLKAPCLRCHQPEATFDFVCQNGHGCTPLSIDDQKIAALQKADLRCTKKSE